MDSSHTTQTLNFSLPNPPGGPIGHEGTRFVFRSVSGFPILLRLVGFLSLGSLSPVILHSIKFSITIKFTSTTIVNSWPSDAWCYRDMKREHLCNHKRNLKKYVQHKCTGHGFKSCSRLQFSQSSLLTAYIS